MKERIFTLKKGVEVADRFDGVTIPFQVPESLGEIMRVAGASENAVQAVARLEATWDSIDLTARNNAVAVFNQAHALNVQKEVKADANEAEATVDSLRAIPKEHKYGQVRVRTGTGNGAARVKPATVNTVLGDDFLSTLTPEQRAMYDAKMAALGQKPATAPAAPAAEKPATGKPGKPQK